MRIWIVGSICMALACSTHHTRQKDAEAWGVGRRIDVTQYGAKGNGKADDSQAIQAALDSAGIGDTVYLPKGTYLVHTIRLVANVHLVSDGLLKQPKELSGQFAVQKQHSDAPLFRAHRISNVFLSFRAETVNEALYASQSRNITISNTHLAGDSTNRRSFSGILWYDCSACRVVGSNVGYYGGKRESPKTYQPGTGIRVLSSNGVTISGNTISHNGENGIFIHDSGDVEIDGNHIHHNGMSGVQIGFSDAERVTNYRVTNNRLEYNAADAVDVNNRAHGKTVAVNLLVAGNYSRENGFVGGQPTPDGSGIATLIGVSDVILSGNRAFGNNRPAVYAEGCGTLIANRNATDGEFELVGQWDNIQLMYNTFPALRLLANAQGKVLELQSNKVGRLMLPNGIRIDSLFLVKNEIGSGPININMEGNVIVEENDLNSVHDAGALLLVNVASAFVKGNRIANAKNAAITVREMAQHVRLDSNSVTSGGVWLQDASGGKTEVSRNQIREYVK